MTTKAEFIKMVLEQGVPVAYQAMLSIVSDPKAPAQSRVAAGRAIFEVGGVTNGNDGGEAKEPHEMSADELRAQIARLRAEALERSRPTIEVEPVLIGQEKGVFD